MARYHLLLCLTLFLTVSCTSTPEMPAAGGALPACGPLPNCVNSDGGEGGSAIEPIAASEDQWRRLKAWLVTQEDWRITKDTGEFIQAVNKTPLMRFRDDIQMRFDANTGLIQVRSSSRLGIGDMGANRKRVEMLRQQTASWPAYSAPD